jgi:anaerobic selenocysteine-containing dehydrogenase
MSEEIETPGEGQVRAFLTVAGNPVSSTPNGRRLDRALASLEFMAAIDIYVNETTRHADVILPPASMLCHDNYDVVFNASRCETCARVNPPVFDKPEGSLYDWEIFNGLGRAYSKAAGVEYKEMPAPMTTLAKVAKAVGGAPHGVDLGPTQAFAAGAAGDARREDPVLACRDACRPAARARRADREAPGADEARRPAQRAQQQLLDEQLAPPHKGAAPRPDVG